MPSNGLSFSSFPTLAFPLLSNNMNLSMNMNAWSHSLVLVYRFWIIRTVRKVDSETKLIPLILVTSRSNAGWAFPVNV